MRNPLRPSSKRSTATGHGRTRSSSKHEPRSQERPLDAVETADAERRELLERRGREVDAADRAPRAGVCDGDDDRLLLVGDAHLATAHGVAVIRIASASCGLGGGKTAVEAERIRTGWGSRPHRGSS